MKYRFEGTGVPWDVAGQCIEAIKHVGADLVLRCAPGGAVSAFVCEGVSSLEGAAEGLVLREIVLGAGVTVLRGETRTVWIRHQGAFVGVVDEPELTQAVGPVRLREAKPSDLDRLAALAVALWPHHTFDEMHDEFGGYMGAAGSGVFVAEMSEALVGFIELKLRHDYVEGCETSPVGFVEGIYIDPKWRGQGLGRALMALGATWAKRWGCTEYASDLEYDNTASFAFHQAAGFAHAGDVRYMHRRI